MTKKSIFILLIGLFLLSCISSAQNDTIGISAIQLLLDSTRFRIDTSAVPEDAFTQKIRELRSVRGPINFDNVIKSAILDKQTNDTTRPKVFYDKLLEDCQSGNTHRIIENLLINLYRQCFTEEEVELLVEFYKSSVGKKMHREFLLLTATAGNAIQNIVKSAADKLESDMNIKE